MAMKRVKSWKTLVNEVVDQLPGDFVLADVLRYRDFMAKGYPKNRFIDAKIRQTLQILRDQGRIQFLGDGHYRRVNTAPAFSLLIDPTVSRLLKSRSQISKQDLETWAELNLYCLYCSTDSLVRFPPSTPVYDFWCSKCEHRYQLKGTRGRFSDVILGAAFQPLVKAIRSGLQPDYVLVEYDTRFNSVSFVRALYGSLIDEGRVTARKALGPTAKRAGWIGCLINVAGLPTINIVEPEAVAITAVRAQWALRGFKK
ncbi:MAG TPA: DpnI domain-containing protein [Candidatus Eremiobacteraceae bacterium]|jgi:hypothetical protein|nr:DpnI domain-containing protein [Candidatus Eremiobacteraceae bacterium]